MIPEDQNHPLSYKVFKANRMKSFVVGKVVTSVTAGFLALLGGGVLLSDDYRPPPEIPVRPKVVTLRSYEQIKHLFASHNYDWETAEQSVPSLLLTALPHDLDQVPTITEKKHLFFLSILPAALLANQEIVLQRERLIDLLQRCDAGQSLSEKDQEFVAAISRQYKIAGDPLAEKTAREKLLKRVDIIPPALILAQAACESGYGTSRFSKLGNNLFGEWCFTPGTGLIPLQRPEGASFELRRFKTLYESVQSYLNNLNTHRAYDTLRSIRSELRSQGSRLVAGKLAEGLRLYSAKREKYVSYIQNIINKNYLFRFSKSQLLFLKFKA